MYQIYVGLVRPVFSEVINSHALGLARFIKIDPILPDYSQHLCWDTKTCSAFGCEFMIWPIWRYAYRIRIRRYKSSFVHSRAYSSPRTRFWGPKTLIYPNSRTGKIAFFLEKPDAWTHKSTSCDFFVLYPCFWSLKTLHTQIQGQWTNFKLSQ